MKQVAIIDTETTGIDPSQHHAIEVAVILYSVEYATPLRAFSSLIQSDRNDAEAINNIPAAALRTAPPADQVFARVASYVQAADAVIAHRAEFDMGFVPAQIRDAKPWACSKFDLAWPKQTRVGEHLVHLALAHGLGISHAHRAMTDCEMISRLLTRIAETGTNLQSFLAYGLRPKATFEAMVSFEEKDKAKDAGFAWDGETRMWTRRMAIEDASQLPFETREVT